VDNALSIGIRCFEILIWNNTKNRLKNCDIIIEPQEIFDFGLFDFGKAEEIVQKAYDNTKIQMPNIRETLLQMREGKNA